jgi:hypothetical protein
LILSRSSSFITSSLLNFISHKSCRSCFFTSLMSLISHPWRS